MYSLPNVTWQRHDKKPDQTGVGISSHMFLILEASQSLCASLSLRKLFSRVQCSVEVTVILYLRATDWISVPPCCCDQTPHKSNLKGKRVCCGSWLEVIVHRGGEVTEAGARDIQVHSTRSQEAESSDH